jgi:FKBP-type peptidyl-prolyl cis-trans isomerase
MRILRLLPLAALACGPSTPRTPAVDTTNLAVRAAMAPAASAAPAPDLTIVDSVYAPATKVSLGSMQRRPDGLYVQELARGSGAAAAPGRGVVVHYVGRLADGTVFDDSRKRGKPARFILGQGVVIKGWDEGVDGMRAGGRRRLVVPPALGYGLAGKPGAIPSAATLVFDVELVEVR